VGDEERLAGTSGEQQLPFVDCRYEQAAFKSSREDL
jgi:hypothetical protein